MKAAVLNFKPAMPLAIFGLMWLAITVILAVEKAPIITIGVPYILIFWYVAWKYPTVALMLVFSIAPFQNDLSRGGARFSLTEVHLALLLPVVLARCYIERRPFRVGVTLIPVLLYFAVCIFATIHYYLGSSTILSILQMALYLFVVVGIFASYPTRAEQFRPALHGLIVICCCIACYSLATRNNFFWGLGKNGVGQALACAVIVCAELWFAAKDPKMKKAFTFALGLLAAGLVFSVSRGAWAGCFAGLFLICVLRRQIQLMLRVGLIMLPLVALAWQFLDPQTKEYAASFDSKRYNIAERYKFIDLAQWMWEQSPVYGNGVGLRKQYDATNLVWSTLAETGVIGLLAFLSIHVVFFVMVFRTQRHLARDSIHYSVLLIGGALVLRHFTHGMVDHYWSRGAVTMAWAGAGMAAYSYFTVQAELRRRRQADMPTIDFRANVARNRIRQRKLHGPRSLPAPIQSVGHQQAQDGAGVSGLPSPSGS